MCEISEWSASLLWNLLRGKGITRAVEGAIRAGHHPLTKFEIQKYYENGPKFNGFYSRNNLPNIMDYYVCHKKSEWNSLNSFIWIVITEENFAMQYISIVLMLNIFEKKFKNSKEKKI